MSFDKHSIYKFIFTASRISGFKITQQFSTYLYFLHVGHPRFTLQISVKKNKYSLFTITGLLNKMLVEPVSETATHKTLTYPVPLFKM